MQREHLRRTERELHGILQKKYEFRRGAGGAAAGPVGVGGAGGMQSALNRLGRLGMGGAGRTGAGGSEKNGDEAIAPLAKAPGGRGGMAAVVPGSVATAVATGDEEFDLEGVDDALDDELEGGNDGKDVGVGRASSHEVRQSRAFASLADFFGA